jgi:hypothetical protein
MNSRPDLAQFIKFTGANEFKIVQPNPDAFFSSSRGPTPEQTAELQRLIYGGAAASSGRSAGPGPGPVTKTPLTTAPKASAGWKYIRKGNRWVAVPDNSGTSENF